MAKENLRRKEGAWTEAPITHAPHREISAELHLCLRGGTLVQDSGAG